MYLDEEGERLTDPEIVARITALVIPPAWRDVWISPDPFGHIQATGFDEAGRKQYLYHPRWHERRALAKFDDMVEFARALPALREVVEHDLALGDLSREQVLACATRLLDRGFFRIGSEVYAVTNETYGLATMLKSHATVDGDTISFDYVAKESKRRVQAVIDPEVAELVATLKRRRGGGRRAARLQARRSLVRREVARHQRLPQGRHGPRRLRQGLPHMGRDGAGRGRPGGDRARAKLGKTARKRAIVRAVKEVAFYLGNTPAVARNSYIDPRVFDRYRDGVHDQRQARPDRLRARRDRHPGTDRGGRARPARRLSADAPAGGAGRRAQRPLPITIASGTSARDRSQDSHEDGGRRAVAARADSAGASRARAPCLARGRAPAAPPDRLGGLLARAVAARAADAAPSRDFRMGAQAHSLTLVNSPSGPVAVMASTPEDVRLKLARVHASLTVYTQRLKDADLAEDAKAKELVKAIATLKSKVDTQIAKVDAKRYEKQVGTKAGAWGKTVPVMALDQEKVDADDAFLESVAAELVDLASKSGVAGLDPDDIEVWVHNRFVKEVVAPKQAAVASVVGPHVASIQAELPGSTVKFRGSLARGLKSFRKPDPTTGGVQRFDPTSFDADAFIELSDEDWEVFKGWGVRVRDKLTLVRALALAEQEEDDEYVGKLTRLLAIESKIQRQLRAVPGYSGKFRGSGKAREWVGDFYLLLQPAEKSASQITEGNPYPEGMLTKAGMPAIEARTTSADRHREFTGKAKFIGETHLAIGTDSSLTKTSTWTGWI